MYRRGFMQEAAMRLSILLTVVLVAADARAQAPEAPDLREAHLRAVQSSVVVVGTGAQGSGWLVELNGRKLVVTNSHVLSGSSKLAKCRFYSGQTVMARVVFESPRVDLMVLEPAEAVADPPLSYASGNVTRGERVVVAGHPGPLRFVTSEGVVAGFLSGTPDSHAACGAGKNCVVIDAQAMRGSSGSPVVDSAGRVIGMLWGGIENTSLSLILHTQTIANELVNLERALPPLVVKQPPARR
jgi:S1-C subfamily serine protease